MSEASTEPPTPTRTRKTKTKRVVNRSPSVYEVQRKIEAIDISAGDVQPLQDAAGVNATFKGVSTEWMWQKAPHGDEVKDTASGEAWIKQNGVIGETYRVVRVCSEKTRREKTVAVLE
jgi:hypothetical protein